MADVIFPANFNENLRSYSYQRKNSVKTNQKSVKLLFRKNTQTTVKLYSKTTRNLCSQSYQLKIGVKSYSFSVFLFIGRKLRVV